MVKLNLLVNKEPVDAVARVVNSSQVERLGRQWVTKFKEHVDRQMFGEFSPPLSFLRVLLTSSQRSSSKLRLAGESLEEKR